MKNLPIFPRHLVRLFAWPLRLCLCFLLMPAGLRAAGEELVLIDAGRARAVIVIPDDAGVMNRHAAKELAVHLEKAAGARLAIVTESALAGAPALPHRVFLGPTAAARAAGFPVDELGEEEAILEARGNDLFMVARREQTWSEWLWVESRRSSGELFAVYDFLDRELGVRWLWPGELGTHVPRRDRVALPADLAREVRPAFRVRRIRWHRLRNFAFRGAEYPEEAERLWFSREGLANYGTALRDFMRRHRDTGGWGMPRIGHDLANLWETHGEKHPEWFVLNSVGEHGHEPDASPFARRNVNVRVSSMGLRDFLVNEYWDGSDHLSLGQADARQMCYHPESIAMYGPQPDLDTIPEAVRGYYEPYFMSNAYAEFWKDIQSRMAERNPKATVATHLYHWYFPAPTSGIRLNDRIVGTFAPWFHERIDRFPMEEEVFEWLKAQWRGWHETGIRLIFRPNHLHKGNFMPYLNMRQTGEMIRYVGNNGAHGYDYSFMGQWAVQGPETYLHFRYLNRPDLEVEEILDEYYAAFGPAAEAVRAYFDYWEEYTWSLIRAGNFNRLRRTGDRAERGHGELLDTHLVFPPEAFEPAREILSQAAAAAAASDNADYVRRVRFLELGLEHALKVVALSAAFDGEHTLALSSPNIPKAVEALRNLTEFRHQYEDWFLSDYIYQGGFLRGPSWSWNVRPLLALMDSGVAEGVEARPLPREGWRFRKDPERRGGAEGWHLPETNIREWEWIAIAQAWQKAGHDYIGTAWYRLDWRAPAEDPTDGTVSLHFQGVDETARVWLNGRSVGTHDLGPAGWNVPFTLDITDTYRRGGLNTLVVEVTNTAANGGIWQPVNLLFTRAEEELDLDPNF